MLGFHCPFSAEPNTPIPGLVWGGIAGLVLKGVIQALGKLLQNY